MTEQERLICEVSHGNFAAARNRAIAELSEHSTIGTLSEKLCHRILKLYIDPNEQNHEIPYLSFIADVKNEQGIFEIQTGSFLPLVKKLEKLLPHSKVTLVHPIYVTKTLFWYDRSTGELSEPRKSPKKGRLTDALPNIAPLGDLISHPNLTVRLMLLAAEEYKCLDGWDKTRKKGSSKIDRIPTSLVGEYVIASIDDVRAMLPQLSDTFTAKDFRRVLRLQGRRAYFALKLLLDQGIIEKVGTQGRAFLYKMSQNVN